MNVSARLHTNLRSKGQLLSVGTGLAPVREMLTYHALSDRGKPCPYGIPLLNAGWYQGRLEASGRCEALGQCEALGRRKARPLLIGIGNPLRSDDGLGWAVAEQLTQDGDAGYDIHTVHQLTPELAQWMAAADLVVMIDASYEGVPGELRIRPVAPSAQPGAVGTHHSTPEELAALTAGIYGYCPPVVVVTMTGADFSVGERLSAVVAGRVHLVCETVRHARIMSDF